MSRSRAAILIAATVGATFSRAQGGAAPLTEEEYEALQFLKGIMAANWDFVQAAVGRRAGETHEEHLARYNKLNDELRAKEDEAVSALQKIRHLETEEVDSILRHFRKGWFSSPALWKSICYGRWYQPSSESVAREELLRRRIAKVPPDELIDHLTAWALEEPPFSPKTYAASRIGAEEYVVEHFTAEEALDALSRWAKKSEVAGRVAKAKCEMESYFSHVVAPDRDDPLPWEEVEKAAAEGPAIVRWLAVRELAYRKKKNAGELALRLLREEADEPFIEEKMIRILAKMPGERLAALDFVDRRIAQGKFSPGNIGAYGTLGKACKGYPQGRRLLAFVRDHAKDEKLKVWAEKLLEPKKAMPPQEIPEN